MLLAFAAVYLVWGSTYIAILWAIEGIPPLLMACLRFLAAGLLMVAWARWRGSPWPARADMAEAFVVGAMMLAIGNGAVSVAESKMPTGITALLVATVPLWVVVMESFTARRLPSTRVATGMVLGVVGVALLSTVDAGWVGGRSDPWFVLMIIAGSAAWAYGSLRSRRSAIASLRMRAGTQMLGGALALGVGALAQGEPLSWASVSARNWLALGYLVLFGSVIAFTSYIWLLRNVSAPAVATYAFVNPVVALALGVWLVSEPLTTRSITAAALIVAAVVLITGAKKQATRRTETTETQAPAELA